MLIVLHGDNTVLSRQALNAEIDRIKKQTRTEVVRLAGKKLTLNQLIEACEAGSLFGTGRLVVIEDLFSHPSKKTLSACLDYLSHVSRTQSVVLYTAKTLTSPQLAKLANFTPRLFKTSSLTFKFLDNLLPGKQAQFLPLFQQAVRQDTIELVFFMLARQVRLLLQVTDPAFKLSPWQASRLKSQYQSFGEAALVKFHDQLYQLDWHLKTGQIALNLQGETELILSTL